MSHQKIVIIGIDGGDDYVFRHMIARGLMPNLKKILDQSISGQMDCYVEGPGQGWASLVTGKRPTKHGIFFWTTYLGLNSNDFVDEKIWDIVGKHGLTSGIVNLSYTFPPKPIKGFMISGLGSGLEPNSNTTFSYPSNLIKELNNNANGYIWGCKYVEGGIVTQNRFLQRSLAMTEKRGEACLYLLGKYRPDLFMVVFRGADAIQHHFWHFIDPKYSISACNERLATLIYRYYSTLDYYLGKIWDNDKNATKFIVADHGFGPTQALFYVNEYLATEGFLVKKHDFRSRIGNTYFLKTKRLLHPLYDRVLMNYAIFCNLNKLRKKKLPKIGVTIDWDKTKLFARFEVKDGKVVELIKASDNKSKFLCWEYFDN